MDETKPIWMPIYVDEYLGGTIGLSNAEHGAYLLCIFKYWKKRSALTDQELKSICRGDYETISNFFILCDGLWHHKRVDIELKRADEKIRTAHEKAMKGVAARKAMIPKRKSHKYVTNGDLKVTPEEAGKRINTNETPFD